MILFNYEGNPGELKDYIDSLKDSDDKDIVYAEYCYFRGNPEECAEIMARYLEAEDIRTRISAWMFYSFSNLALARTEEVRRGIAFISYALKNGQTKIADKDIQSLFVLVANAGNVLMDLQIKNVAPLNEYLGNLPRGLKVLGCYIMSHKAYLDGEYGKGLGIVEACLALEEKDCLISNIYLYLAGAMNAMSLGNVKLGKEFFKKAYENAEPDGLFEPLGEHHGLLQGLVETCLKKSKRKDFEKIIDITYRFSYGWRCVHNPIANDNVADMLSTTEFTVAMLANRGWTNMEIADYMGLNINTIKSYLTSVFNKLGISSRKELSSFMLK